MMKQKQKLIIIFFMFGLFLPLSYVSAGTIVSPHKYAWSNNVGYINFANVTVSDTTVGGYAWSTNKGFINFSPAQGGVSNDGTGNLSGSAWGEQLGYIDFDGVSINSSTGQFSGTATGTLVGVITFDCNFCDVQTDWRQITPSNPSSGGGGGSGRTLPTVNPNNTITSNVLPVLENPLPGAVVVNAGTVPETVSTESPALLDILAAPIQATQSATSRIFLSVLSGILISWLTLFLVNKKREQKNENIQ